MADPKIKFKRSAVAGKIPTAAQVPLGELALNTNDGILYASKDVGAGTTVIAVNPFRVGTGTDSYNTFFTAGNVGINSTIPTSKLDVDGDVKLSGVITATTFSGSGASLTNLPAANLTGTLPAISGANLTNLNASNLTSGTVPTARIPTLNQDTSGTAAGLTGSPTIGVTSITASGTVGIGSTLPLGKLDVAGSVNIKDGTTTSTTTTGGVVFDGSDDILHSNQADSDFTLGSNDFTVEYFIKFDTVGNSAGNAAALILSQLGSISYAPSFGTFESGSFVFKYSGTGSGWRSSKSLGTVTTGVWYHIAIVRSGNTFYTFQNGVQQATWTESNAVHQPSSGVILGRRANSIHQSALDGTISNVRVVVGTALYTSGFTTPTAELTNVSNTKFLALQSTSSATAATVIPSGVTLSTVSAPAATSSGPGLTASTTVATSGDLHVSGISTFTSDVNVGGGLSVTGNSFFVGVVTFAAGTDGNIVLGDAATDNVVFNADVNSNIVPNTNNAYDLGSSSQKWRNLFISGNANIGGTLTYEDVTNIDSVGIITARKNIELPDSTGATVGRILFGAGDDLQIYHDGSHSYIDDAGTGNLRLRSGTLEILNLAGSKKSAVFNSGSGQELYFDNSKKFETVTGGVTITGTATATLFSGSGASLTNLNATNLASGTIPDARFPAALPAIDGSALTGITASGTGAIGGLTIKNQSGAVVGTAGSVSTIDFDGSAGVTVTATTGAAGIATVLISASTDLVTDTSPQLGGNLDLNGNNITGSGNIPAANLTGTLPAISVGGDLSIVDKIVHTGNTNTSIGFPSNNKVQFATSGSPRMTLDSSGRVLIGTTGAPAGTDAQYSRLVIRGNTQSATAVAYLSLGNGKTTSDTGTNENLGILTFNDNDNDAGEYARIIGASDGSNGTDDYPGKLIFSTTADGGSAPTERMRITSTGKIAIGKTNPIKLLCLEYTLASTGSEGIRLQDATNTTSSFFGTTGSSYTHAGVTGHNTLIYGARNIAILADGTNSGSIKFAAGNSERMRITSTGRLGLGTQNPVSTLEVVGDAKFSGAVSVGGVLTYEDVTNIDSVGLSTFRAGVNITGTATATLFSGSGASLTNLPAANLTGTLPAISGANLTNLDASDLASGTVPDGRFPATLPAASGANLTNLPAANLTGTLPAISGVNLTNLDASDLASGTIPDARFPATLPAISGANLTNVNATVAGISTAGTSTFNHVSVTGVATVSTAFYLPQYTTTARDAGTFNEGAMIYNTTTKKMEFYDGTNWNTLPGVTLGLGMGVF